MMNDCAALHESATTPTARQIATWQAMRRYQRLEESGHLAEARERAMRRIYFRNVARSGRLRPSAELIAYLTVELTRAGRGLAPPKGAVLLCAYLGTVVTSWRAWHLPGKPLRSGFHATLADLSEVCGAGARTLTRVLAWLEEVGLLTRVRLFEEAPRPLRTDRGGPVLRPEGIGSDGKVTGGLFLPGENLSRILRLFLAKRNGWKLVPFSHESQDRQVGEPTSSSVSASPLEPPPPQRKIRGRGVREFERDTVDILRLDVAQARKRRKERAAPAVTIQAETPTATPEPAPASPDGNEGGGLAAAAATAPEASPQPRGAVQTAPAVPELPPAPDSLELATVEQCRAALAALFGGDRPRYDAGAARVERVGSQLDDAAREPSALRGLVGGVLGKLRGGS